MRHENRPAILSGSFVIGTFRSTRRFVVLLPAFFLLFAFISCSPKKSGVREINLWAMGTEGEFVQQLIPEFEKQNPGIKVKVQMIPWTAAQEKLITAYASDNCPDIFQLGNTWIPQFASLKAIEPLDKLVNGSKSLRRDNYFEGIWNTNVVNGLTYGIPWYIDTRAMYYRKDILAKAGFENPPRTWEELYQCCKKIKENSGGKNFSLYVPTNEWAHFAIFGLQAGSTLLKNNDSYGDFRGPQFRAAFEYLMKFYKEGFTPVGISEITNIYQSFSIGYISMYISGPWNIREFQRWMTGDLKDKWAVAPLPGYGNNYPGVSLAGGSSLVMYSKSKHKDDVWKLIEFLSLKQTQLKFYDLTADLPAVKDAWDEPALKNDKYISAFYEQFMHVMPTPKIVEWEQLAFAKLQQYVEYAARGYMSVDQALAALDQDVNRILEKRRWILEKEGRH